MSDDTGTTEQRRLRGMGNIYRRGRVLWVRYSHRGVEYRESAGSDRPAVAERLLRKRLREQGRPGRFIGPRADKILVSDLLDALARHYEVAGRRSLATLKHRLAPLREAFGLDRAVDVSGESVERYKQERLRQRTRRYGTAVTPATLNRELAALKRAFRLAVEQERLAWAPAIRLLPERNLRTGFVEPDTFEEIARRLPSPIDDAARFAYLTAWRKAEVLGLEWRDVDLGHRRLRLRPERSKNAETRVLPLAGELLDLVRRREEARLYKDAEGEPRVAEYVFHRQGRRIVDIRDPWATACKGAGVPGLLFHDLRRSAIRNLMRAGTDQATAMRISGHKTISTFLRYRITSEHEVEQALAAAERANRAASGIVHRAQPEPSR